MIARAKNVEMTSRLRSPRAWIAIRMPAVVSTPTTTTLRSDVHTKWSEPLRRLWLRVFAIAYPQPSRLGHVGGNSVGVCLSVGAWRRGFVLPRSPPWGAG